MENLNNRNMVKIHKYGFSFVINKYVWIMILVPVASLIMLSAVEAYVLHGSHLLKLMADGIGSVERLKVEQTLVIHEYHPAVEDVEKLESEETPEEEIDSIVETFELTETLMFVFPDKFRSEIKSAQVERFHVVSRGSSVTIIDNERVADYETAFDHYKDIFLFNSRSLLESRMPQLGVDIGVTSLGKFNSRIGYVIGAQYPDETSPQLWLDRETFRPFRWLVRPGAVNNPADSLEVRYYGWRQFGDIWYPSRIEFYQGELLARTIRVQRLNLEPELPADLFDINTLRSRYPISRQTPADKPESTDGEGEVQETLDRFRKIFE
jgi:hypothetical protein